MPLHAETRIDHVYSIIHEEACQSPINNNVKQLSVHNNINIGSSFYIWKLLRRWKDVHKLFVCLCVVRWQRSTSGWACREVCVIRLTIDLWHLRLQCGGHKNQHATTLLFYALFGLSSSFAHATSCFILASININPLVPSPNSAFKHLSKQLFFSLFHHCYQHGSYCRLSCQRHCFPFWF